MIILKFSLKRFAAAMQSKAPAGSPSQSPRLSLPMLPVLPEISRSHSPRPDQQVLEMIAAARETCREAAKLDRQGTGKKSRLDIIVAAKAARKNLLSNRLSILSKEEAKNRHRSYVNNLYIDILQEGHYKTFEEIFRILKQQAADRLKGGTDSVRWLQTPLESQPNKLNKVAEFLQKAEEEELQGNFNEVYDCNFALAKFFQAPEDSWLTDHFFENCLTFSKFIQGDDGRKTAEAHCFVGLAAEKRGNLPKALENLSAYYTLTLQKNWITDSNEELLHSDACCQLSRIYFKMAQKQREDGDKDLSLNYYEQAFELAKESEDAGLFSNATYELGMAFHQIGDSETALQHFHNYLDHSQATGDIAGLAKAYDAIASSYQSDGKMDEAIEAYHEFIKLADETKDDIGLARASLNLGALHNCMGNYLQSAANFIKAFSVSQTEGSDRVLINASRVQYGISVGHQLLPRFIKHLYKNSLPSWERLLDWKDYKKNEFDKPIPPKDPKVRREARRVQQLRQEREEKIREKEKKTAVTGAKKPRRASTFIRKS